MENTQEEAMESASEERSEENGNYGDQQLRSENMSIENYDPHQESEDPNAVNMATNSSITNQVPVTTNVMGKESQKTVLNLKV